MWKIRYLQLILVFFFLPAMVMGCLALIVGAGAAGGVLYYKGSLKADLEARPDRVIVATNKAFMDLNWKEISSSSSKTDGKATAKQAPRRRWM
jgi:hypothetical protein